MVIMTTKIYFSKMKNSARKFVNALVKRSRRKNANAAVEPTKMTMMTISKYCPTLPLYLSNVQSRECF
eukprot:2005631-Ditylum_brightwellii.AAC.1